MGGHQQATAFSRPGVVAGEIERVSLDARIGESVVVLAFYPSDFGPKSGQSAALLRAVERLSSEGDAEAVGVAPESVYSHQRFAEEAGIDVPLVSDASGEIAETYGVAASGDSGQPLVKRALFVVDYRGVIVHEWTADHVAAMPAFDEVRAQIETITPDRSAQGSYRVGYAHYREGRRYLSNGFEHCEAGNWGLAGSAFTEACQEFSEATEVFTAGQRLADDGPLRERNSRGRQTATTYWEAAEWLAGFATASRKENAANRRESRTAAEEALQQVRDVTLPEPEGGPVSTDRSASNERPA